MHDIEPILIVQLVTLSEDAARNTDCMLFFNIELEFNSARFSTSDSYLKLSVR